MKITCHHFNIALFIVTAFISIFYATGCATIMTGKYQEVPVTSEPNGANIKAETGETITTPGKLHLLRNISHNLVAEYAGYESQKLTLHNKAQGWVWGNILFGGIIGLAVDCGSGASDELIPKEVHFDFKNPQLTTKEAVKAEKVVAKSPDSNTPVKPTVTEPNTPPEKSFTVINCEKCSHEIARYEKAYVSEGHIVCSECYLKAKNKE